MNYNELINLIYNAEKPDFRKISNISLAFSKIIKNDIINSSKKKDFFKSVESVAKVHVNLKQRMDLTKESLTGFIKIYEKDIALNSPLVCGLGATHVLETSLTLHHIWGIPYIPGSSLKGVCRKVAFWKLVEEKNLQNENDINELQKKFYGDLAYNDTKILTYQLLFGAQDFKGILTFLDVYPDTSTNDGKIFRLDIMNPHYSSYYSDDSGETPPGDWENPIPIFFLTVKEGVKFRFVVLFDNYRWKKIKENGLYITNEEGKKEKVNIPSNEIEQLTKDNKFLEGILKQALETYGLGSKTRLGYGSFRVQN